MANLSQLIERKSHNDEQWKAQKQAERENAVAMQDAGMAEIGSNPEAYAQYLDLQGANPTYSPGNIALAMLQNPDLTVLGTRERWKSLGRTVKDSESGRGVQIFARSPFGKGYSLTPAFDISQTTGRELRQVALRDDTKEMEAALTMLLNYSVVPIKADGLLNVPAWYDEGRMELSVNPNVPDHEAFAAIATEVAHIRFHSRGANGSYDRGESELDAQSVSYLLCKRFGVKRDMPELSGLAAIYNGWTPQEIRQALDAVQDMAKTIGNSIEKSITPQQHSRGQTQRRAVR